MDRIINFIRLTRPANIVTAISDILAGVTIAAALSLTLINYDHVLFLVLATIGLYGGGVVFNDVFDAELDKVERPERPIPSGIVSKSEGAVFGSILLIIGIGAACVSSIYPSGVVALLIAIAALVYDKWGKHHSILGPLNMGLCRGLNLVLGMSIVGVSVFDFAFIGVIPIIYIAAITMISRGEVHGGKSTTMQGALVFYLIVMGSILYAGYRHFNLLFTIILLAAFALMTLPPLFRAMREPVGRNIGKAVKAGVVGLILMNASWAAAFGAFYSALVILMLLPVSILLARLFAVT